MSASILRYASQASSQTLREGLAEYYEHNPALLDPAQMDPQAARLFRQHDAAHVVFGCDTSLRGEALIDTWTIFGSTIGLRGCLGDVVRVIWRSQRLRQKWTWRGYDAQLDQPLAEIRERFGIRIV